MSINNNKSVGVAYTDYRPAFESISINKLLLKLRSLGISGQLLSRIGRFLQKRWQLSRVGAPLSHVTMVTSGVEQRNVIGPRLLVLIINNIVRLFDDNSCVLKPLADDVELSKQR